MMAELSCNFFPNKENLDHHQHQEIFNDNIIIPTKKASDLLHDTSLAKESKRNNVFKEDCNHEKQDRLSRYLDQMAARRGQLKAIGARPKWALMPIERIQTTKFADDDETKLLGSKLEDFFNTALNTLVTTPTPEEDEPEWKGKSRMAQQAGDSWLETLKAGQKWKSTPNSTKKEGIKKEIDIQSTPTVLTTSLDDLQTLMGNISQSPAKSFNDTFKPIFTNVLNERNTLDDIPSTISDMRQHQEITEEALTTSDFVEALDEACSSLSSALDSPDSGLCDNFSRQSDPTELVCAGDFLQGLLPHEEATDAIQGLVPSSFPHTKEHLDNVFIAPQDSLLLGSLTQIANSRKSSSAVDGSSHHTADLDADAGRVTSRDFPTASPTKNLGKDPSNSAHENLLTGTVFTIRLPTLEEVLESIINPSRTVAILEACGARFPESVQNVSSKHPRPTLSSILQTSPTPPPTTALPAAEFSSCWSATYDTELTKSNQIDREQSCVKIFEHHSRIPSNFKATAVNESLSYTSPLSLSATKPLEAIFSLSVSTSEAPATSHGAAACKAVDTSSTAEEPLLVPTPSTTISAKSKATFTLFSTLPERLRKKIWAHARPGPRIIKLCVSLLRKSIFTTASVPALLHVCRESRILAQGWYELSFSSHQFCEPKVYFDFTRDGIYTRCRGCIGTNCLHKKTWAKDHEKVKFLIFEAPMSFKPFKKIARLYPAVEELILVKGKSMIPRREIVWEDLGKFEQAFSWQGHENDLVAFYAKWLEGEEQLLRNESRMRKITRMTLPGVMEVVDPGSLAETCLWTCCM